MLSRQRLPTLLMAGLMFTAFDGSASATSADYVACQNVAIKVLQQCLLEHGAKSSSNEQCWPNSQSAFSHCVTQVDQQYAEASKAKTLAHQQAKVAEQAVPAKSTSTVRLTQSHTDAIEGLTPVDATFLFNSKQPQQFSFSIDYADDDNFGIPTLSAQVAEEEPWQASLYAAELAAWCVADQHTPVFFIDHNDEVFANPETTLLSYRQQGWQTLTVNGDELADLLTVNHCVQEQYQQGLMQSLGGANAQPIALAEQYCHCQFPDDLWQRNWHERLSLAVLGANSSVEENAPGLRFPHLDESFNTANSVSRTMAMPLYPVADESALRKLLSEPRFTESYLANDVKLADGRFINIVVHQGVYRAAGFGLVEQQGHWFWFYQAGVSSKGFLPMFAVKPQANGNIAASVCVDDCSWWGRNAEVMLNFSSRTITFIDFTDAGYLSTDDEAL